MTTREHPNRFLIVSIALLLISASPRPSLTMLSGSTATLIQDPQPPQPGPEYEPQLELTVDCPGKADEHSLCLVKVITNAKHSQVTVRRTLFDTVKVYELKALRSYGWTGPPGEHLVEVRVYDPDIGLEDEFMKVVVGEVDPDPDDPDDLDPPDPAPTDAPFPTHGFTVLILKEAKEVGGLPESQKAIFTSREIRDYLTRHYVRDDNIPSYRFWDDDYGTDELAEASDMFRAAYRAVLEDADGTLPWIAISDGKSRSAGSASQSANRNLPNTGCYSIQ